ncbi:MAG: hypothetical protein WAZ12_02070 [Candidatus Absconditicoccaceae bacterium]
MKKSYLLLIFILCIVFTLNGQTLGQTSGNLQNTQIGLVDSGGVPEDPALQGNKLNYIDTRFCNDGLEEDKLTDNLSIVTKPGEEKEICVIHLNRNSEDIYLWGGFPDNAIEPNGNINCSSNYERNNPFSKFIEPFKENFITVPAKGYVIRKTTIKFPVGINGIQKGCFAYGLDSGKLKEGENFLFVIRRIAYINVLVQGDGSINSQIKINKITSEIQENKTLGIEFDIENKGSIDETVSIDGEISNIFGYKETFSTTGVIISVNNKKTLNIKDFGVNIELPRYKGPFNLKLNINHKPYFGFDVSNSGIDPKILEGGNFNQNKSIFIFPTIAAILLLVFIVLVYFAFFKKPRVIIQQVQAPTPTPTVPQ